MQFYSITLGERILILRHRAGLSKTKLAEMAGVSASTITKYENDEVVNPDVDTLANIAIALGVTLNMLIVGIRTPKGKELTSLIS